jgi:HD-like signal output (HDOD) protein
MIKKDEIDNFIEKIPPAPKILLETIEFLKKGELTKAADMAKNDFAICSYLKTVVNAPIYGFRSEISDIKQIFAIFGVGLSYQVVYNYMISLLSPSKWELFTLNKALFYSLQANLSKRWEKILLHLDIKDKDIYSSIALLPASIIVTEALFSKHKQEVLLLRETKNLDYNTILKRLSGLDLFDISSMVAQKWHMPKIASDILVASSGTREVADEQIVTLAKWMHLLLFYELSQESFINSGLNDFIEFNIDFVGEIYEDFAKLMDIS